ncbi:phage head closure protein [Pandoraea bronchicola]|uniref:Head-tail adaptor protein n=1 Tax=Pandoraea bronchicola TaxID=2508287 RepID=A0A5E5BQZ8_9BURK|nr:phage head closure protein [Pandoraea bronchicola]VVE87562.1 head-tail adaptor protein [Pandoraea bronchicola]
MRAGTLNRRVRIERREQGYDDLGQPVDSWIPIAPPLCCNVLMQTGKEAIASDSEVGVASASIRIRFRTDIDEGMRAVLLKYVDGRPVDEVVFNIGKPLPDFGGRDYTDLPCTTGANNG